MTCIVTYFIGFNSVVWCFGQSLNHAEVVPGLDMEGTTSQGRITYEGEQNLCPQNTVCTVIAECRLLIDLMDRACLQFNRLKELSCGYRKTEIMICCPDGGNTSPFASNHRRGHRLRPKNETKVLGLNHYNCGRPQLNGWKNGYSGVGSQPWVARIGYKAENKESVDYPCCGSIIADTVVLTAAHCALAEHPGYALHSVRVGDYDEEDDPDCTQTFCAHPAQDIEVSHVIAHPGFEKSLFRHDVALLVLKKAIHYSVAAQPVCLPQNPNIGLVGRRGKLIGWGKLAGEVVAAKYEQELDLPVIPLEVCSRIYGKLLPVTSSQLCVGGEPRRDACSGFGGAPLVMVDHIYGDRYYQVGILSFGSDRCGEAGVPSVYTRIQHYFDWINANIPS